MIKNDAQYQCLAGGLPVILETILTLSRLVVVTYLAIFCVLLGSLCAAALGKPVIEVLRTTLYFVVGISTVAMAAIAAMEFGWPRAFRLHNRKESSSGDSVARGNNGPTQVAEIRNGSPFVISGGGGGQNSGHDSLGQPKSEGGPLTSSPAGRDFT